MLDKVCQLYRANPHTSQPAELYTSNNVITYIIQQGWIISMGAASVFLFSTLCLSSEECMDTLHTTAQLLGCV